MYSYLNLNGPCRWKITNTTVKVKMRFLAPIAGIAEVENVMTLKFWGSTRDRTMPTWPFWLESKEITHAHHNSFRKEWLAISTSTHSRSRYTVLQHNGYSVWSNSLLEQLQPYKWIKSRCDSLRSTRVITPLVGIALLAQSHPQKRLCCSSSTVWYKRPFCKLIGYLKWQQS